MAEAAGTSVVATTAAFGAASESAAGACATPAIATGAADGATAGGEGARGCRPFCFATFSS